MLEYELLRNYDDLQKYYEVMHGEQLEHQLEQYQKKTQKERKEELRLLNSLKEIAYHLLFSKQRELEYSPISSEQSSFLKRTCNIGYFRYQSDILIYYCYT